MTISLKHAFTTLKSDGVDTSLVQPSNWNAEHVLSLAAGKVLGRDTSGDGVAQELPIAVTAAGDVDFNTGVGYIKIPGGTTAQRPGSPAARMIRYNSTTGKVEFYSGSAWAAVSGAEVPLLGVIDYAGRSEPTDGIWKYPNGQAVSRTDFAAAFAALVFTSTVTMTIATPAVVTWVANGLSLGDPVKFSTTGALPTGLVAGTIYYAKPVTADTFKLTDTPNGTEINTSGSQSGVHTAVSAPYGDGNGTTTFNLPDIRGRTVIGHDAMGAAVAGRMSMTNTQGVYGISLGGVGGEQSHTLVTAEMPAHTHTAGNGSGSAGSGGGSGFNFANPPGTSGSTGGDGAHNNVQPGIVMNKLIRVA